MSDRWKGLSIALQNNELSWEAKGVFADLLPLGTAMAADKYPPAALDELYKAGVVMVGERRVGTETVRMVSVVSYLSGGDTLAY